MNHRQKDWQILNALRLRALSRSDVSSAPPAMREALALDCILQSLPIFHTAGDLLAGDFGWREEEAESFERRFPPPQPQPDARSGVTPEAQLYADFHCFGGYSPAHTCIDYGKLLALGIDGVLAQIDGAGAGAYRDAMKTALGALQRLAERYAALLEQSGQLELAAICRRVPRKAARTFHEALQSIWFAHMAIGISESSDASISLGRLDQYALPYYQKSLDAGCSETEMEEQFAALVSKLNRYGDAACALNLGGVDDGGHDLCNDLTRLIIRVVKRMRRAAPILAARVHRALAPDVFDALVDPALFAIGQPTFYGEMSCRAALRERGVPESEIPRWAANSCMGLVIEGCEVSNMWGGVVNCLLPLELSINRGRPLQKGLPIALHTAPLEDARTFDAVEGKFLEYLNEMVDFCVRSCRACTERARDQRPNPYVSAFLDRCIERGRDRLDGGAQYSVAIIEAFGLVNAADALSAIRALVFEGRQYSLEETVEAVRANYLGHEGLLARIRALPKYGGGNAQADAAVARLAGHFQRMVRSHSTATTCYAPSFHTLNVHVGAGRKTAASLDGRRAGEPLAKNIGPSAGNACGGPTGVVRSAAAIDQRAYFGGQALDLSVDANLMANASDRRKLQSLIHTYFELGGLQLQVNGLSAETLSKAIERPEQYRDLIVRIGGYSDYFNNLSVDVRHEMVRRVADGL